MAAPSLEPAVLMTLMINTGTFIYVGIIHWRLRRLEQPLTRQARHAAEQARHAAETVVADYRYRTARRRDDKDVRQLAAEIALDTMRGGSRDD